MGVLGTMVVNFTANVSGLQSGANQAKSSIADLGGTANSILGTAAVAFTAVAGAAIAGGVAATKMAGDFQAGITSLVTGAGEAQSNVKLVSDGILDLATKTGTSTQLLTSGMYQIESAGYHGADGLNVLQTAAEGAKTGNADLGTVAKAMTIEMTDYHMKASDAAEAMNGLTATVKNGRANLSQLAPAMGSVLPVAASLGISFPQVAGALDTMTNAGVPAQKAATNLASVLTSLSAPSSVATKAMTSVGLSAQQVKDTLVNQGLPAALSLIEDHIGAKFPAGSVAGTTALKSIMGGISGLKLDAETGGVSLSTLSGNISNVSKAMKDGGNSVTGWSNVQSDFNFKIQQAQETVETMGIKIGTALLPAMSNLLSSVMPIVTSFGNWISSSGILVTATNAVSTAITNVANFIKNAITFFEQNRAAMAALQIGVIVLAAAIGSILVAALIASAAAAWIALAPFLVFSIPFVLVGVAIALVIIYFNQLKAAFLAVGAALGGNAALQGLINMLKDLGSFLSSVFTPLWDYLVNTVWKGQLLPMFQQLGSALSSLSLLWQVLAAIVGVVVLTAIAALIGVLTGLAKGFAYLITGLAAVLAGIIQFFTGVIQFVGGILRVIIDLITGNFSDLGPAFYQILQGLYNIFVGAWTAIVGVLTTVFGTIWGLVSGFVQGFIGFFISLFDQLVGHSIIPDMVNAIVTWIGTLVSTVISAIVAFVSNLISWFIQLNVDAVQQVLGLVNGVINWFSQLPGKVMGFLNTLPGMISNLWNTIITDATNAGSNIVNGIANGIRAAIGAVGSAIGAVTDFISAHLPHSPAKIGPLRDLQLQGSLIPEQISTGILSNMSKLDSTMNKLPYPGSSSTSNSSAAVLAALAAGNSNGNNQPIENHIYIDGKEVTSKLGPHIANAIRAKGVRK